MLRRIIQAGVAVLAISAAWAQDGLRWGWGGDVHQVVVVKASSLVSPSLQRQILRHRRQILRGCLDALRESGWRSSPGTAVRSAYADTLQALRTGAHFSDVCYKLGRLSALLGEYESVVNTNAGEAGIEAFRDFVAVYYSSFALVVVREGEHYLRNRSLDEYLDYVARRNAARSRMVAGALRSEGDEEQWRDPRSRVFGAASLAYNDLVLDSARVWLLLWQEAGGSVANAPYFALEPVRVRP